MIHGGVWMMLVTEDKSRNGQDTQYSNCHQDMVKDFRNTLKRMLHMMFSLAVIPKELKTGKLSVDVFSEVLIRNHPCKTNKRVRLETITGGQGQHGGMIELELCEEDQYNEDLGNLHVTLTSADERKPRLAVGQYMTIVAITADDDLLSMYGINKVKSCLRDRNDAMFFAGPCTGGSSWARLNRTRSVETAMLIRRRQVMFWKLFAAFERLMEPRPSIQFRSLLDIVIIGRTPG